MNDDKMSMLKATIGKLQTISIGYIKNILNVSSDEADEMLQGLIQAGAVEPFSFDGTNYRVVR